MASSAPTPRAIRVPRAERLETRVTAVQKQLIERAACAQGRTLSDFVATTLQEAARKVIEEARVWDLSEEQQRVFIEALLNPPAPNENLRAAADRYQTYKAAVRTGSR